jgi:flavin reductase (DIM6/NTAB) family NADH-FMN oxidoreductase RutF
MHPTPDADHLRATYRKAISRFVTGVTLITTCTEEGLVGMTANAVTSLSLQPLQLIVCIGNGFATINAISVSGRFAVNILGHEHHDVPVLANAMAYFVCDVAQAVPGGDHTIVIGNVVACGFNPGTRPLLYFGSDFGALCDEQAHAGLAFDWHLASSM